MRWRRCPRLLAAVLLAPFAADTWHLAYSPPSPLSACTTRGRARLYLDTADEKQWAKHLPLGIFDGITTNPELCRRAGVAVNKESLSKLARSALDQVDEVMVQAWGGTAKKFVETGMSMFRVDPSRVAVKLPLTRAGVEAASVLREQGVRLCMTACYTPHQVFTAVGLGAEFVAPYLGRICDNYEQKGLGLYESGRSFGRDSWGTGRDEGFCRPGADLTEPEDEALHDLKVMQQVVNGMGASTRVLVASIRKPEFLSLLAAAGCDSFTFSPEVAEALCGVELTEEAARNFEEAAKVAGVEES